MGDPTEKRAETRFTLEEAVDYLSAATMVSRGDLIVWLDGLGVRDDMSAAAVWRALEDILEVKAFGAALRSRLADASPDSDV